MSSAAAERAERRLGRGSGTLSAHLRAAKRHAIGTYALLALTPPARPDLHPSTMTGMCRWRTRRTAARLPKTTSVGSQRPANRNTPENTVTQVRVIWLVVRRCIHLSAERAPRKVVT